MRVLTIHVVRAGRVETRQTNQQAMNPFEFAILTQSLGRGHQTEIIDGHVLCTFSDRRSATGYERLRIAFAVGYVVLD